MKNMLKSEFELKAEHITILKDLCIKYHFETAYDEYLVPRIDVKRPFGNSGVLYDIAGKLGWDVPEDDEAAYEDVMKRAQNILLEIPVALEIILNQHTFEPGIYEVDGYGAYFEYKIARNFLILKDAYEECMTIPISCKERIETMFKNIIDANTNPFENILSQLKDMQECIEKRDCGLATADSLAIKMMIDVVKKYNIPGEVKKLLSIFPKSFVNRNNEFIAEPKHNQYFILRTCKTVLDVKCKVLEWLSRSASYSVFYEQEWRNEKYHQKMLSCINEYLGTNFTKEQIEIIYSKLGNCVHHEKTIAFIKDGYNFSVLDK